LRKIKKTDLHIYGLFNELKSFAKETYEIRGRLGLSLKRKLSDNVFVGVNSLLNLLDAGDFFIWRNALRGIYEPFDGTQSFGKRQRFNIDPYIHYFTRGGNSHKINTRYFYTNNENNNNQQNKSTTYYGEYQYNHVYESLNLNLTLGLVGSVTNSDAELFGDTSFLYRNSAAFVQFDKKFGTNLTMSAGLRYEYNSQESPEKIDDVVIPNGKVTDDQVISRLGLNYNYSEYGSVRVSWGQGYRYPTVTERFIRTQFGGFFIFPNPILNPEYGWSSELGIKQGIKLSAFKGFIDLSGFISEYEDMIEFTFLENPYGFKPINIGNTRITGYETSITGQIKLGKIDINLLTGYTFINPIYKNFEERPEIKTNVSTPNNILKYRSKHNAKIDLEANYKKVSIGFSTQYYSHVINIDKRFENPLTDLDLFAIKAFRDQNNSGYSIVDARASFSFSRLKISLLCNNLLNNAYSVRPGLLEAPRNISLRLDTKF
jgi:iron complex outermembrane receptor protein